MLNSADGHSCIATNANFSGAPGKLTVHAVDSSYSGSFSTSPSATLSRVMFDAANDNETSAVSINPVDLA